MKRQTVQERISKHIHDLSSIDKKISARAEGYLLRYYGVKALDQLITACFDPDPQMRWRCAWVLGHTHGTRAYETILRLMTQDPSGFVRYDAAVALGILGDERAIAPLISLMLQPDEENCVDSAASMGLVRLGKSAIPSLLEVLNHGTETHQCIAAWVLGSLHAEQATALIAVLLSSPNENTRITGIEALAEIGNEDCLTLIKPCQHDSIARVSQNAAYWVRELQSALTAQKRTVSRRSRMEKRWKTYLAC
jgi:HEAT repeat protein